MNEDKEIAGYKNFLFLLMFKKSARFNTHVRTLKRHIRLKRIQRPAFSNVKTNLQEKKEIPIQVDYSENYTNKDEGQV